MRNGMAQHYVAAVGLSGASINGGTGSTQKERATPGCLFRRGMLIHLIPSAVRAAPSRQRQEPVPKSGLAEGVESM